MSHAADPRAHIAYTDKPSHPDAIVADPLRHLTAWARKRVTG